MFYNMSTTYAYIVYLGQTRSGRNELDDTNRAKRIPGDPNLGETNPAPNELCETQITRRVNSGKTR